MAVVAFLAACGGGAAEEVPAVDSNAVDSAAVVVEEVPAADSTSTDTTAAAEVTPAA